jgi:protein-tyrosine-phosphatase
VTKQNFEKTKSVLFVCAANQCRSPMAMILFKDLIAKSEENLIDWQIESAGIWAANGYPATKDAAFVITSMGLDLLDHRSQLVTESLLNRFNLILCMENDQVNYINRIFPTARDKVFRLSEMADQKKDILDPVGHPQYAYKHTANEILEYLKNGFSKIIQLSK